MLYDLSSIQAGEIVTVKLITGVELLASVSAGINESAKEPMIGLRYPKIVVVGDHEIAVVPYTFTSNAEFVSLPIRHILSISHTGPKSAEDYQKMVDEESAQKVKK